MRPSDRRLLKEYRRACEALATTGASSLVPPPPRPAPQRKPCKACGASGLVEGEFPSVSEQSKVAIIGGGIGGAAVALALRQRGLHATVYERDRSFSERAQGYGLTMQQGANALRDLGLPNEGVFSVAHNSFLPDGTLLGSYGRGVHATTREQLGNGKGDAQRRNAHIPRQALRKTLLDALPPGTVEWGKRLERVEEAVGAEGGSGDHEPAVALRFSDGSVARADVVVAADGIWSSVRRQLLPTDPAPLRYLGVVVVLGRAACNHPLVTRQVFQTLDASHYTEVDPEQSFAQSRVRLLPV